MDCLTQWAETLDMNAVSIITTSIATLVILLCLTLLDRRLRAMTAKIDKLAKRAKKNTKLARRGGMPAQRVDAHNDTSLEH